MWPFALMYCFLKEAEKQTSMSGSFSSLSSWLHFSSATLNSYPLLGHIKLIPTPESLHALFPLAYNESRGPSEGTMTPNRVSFVTESNL